MVARASVEVGLGEGVVGSLLEVAGMPTRVVLPSPLPSVTGVVAEGVVARISAEVVASAGVVVVGSTSMVLLVASAVETTVAEVGSGDSTPLPP